jgi:tetratricopeptide (TPR) repeat protein
MELFKNKKTRALIVIMSALVLSGVAISYSYYKNINESIDPRIVKARTLYEKYNVYAQKNEFNSIFSLMDSIELIYTDFDHYKNSYEMGVLYNNRAASFLTMALYTDDIAKTDQDSLINLAEFAVKKSIEIYNQWLKKFQNKSPIEIEGMILNDFYTGLENYNTDQKNKFIKNRINEISDSQAETKRRLSVSYTNLGIINRHKLQYEAAANCYKKAIDLWDRNLTAENNLNVLLGRPMKKRSFIQKLFPPDRDQN